LNFFYRTYRLARRHSRGALLRPEMRIALPIFFQAGGSSFDVMVKITGSAIKTPFIFRFLSDLFRISPGPQSAESHATRSRFADGRTITENGPRILYCSFHPLPVLVKTTLVQN